MLEDLNDMVTYNYFLNILDYMVGRCRICMDTSIWHYHLGILIFLEDLNDMVTLKLFSKYTRRYGR